jgi:hypothetical protein
VSGAPALGSASVETAQSAIIRVSNFDFFLSPTSFSPRIHAFSAKIRGCPLAVSSGHGSGRTACLPVLAHGFAAPR